MYMNPTAPAPKRNGLAGLTDVLKTGVSIYQTDQQKDIASTNLKTELAKMQQAKELARSETEAAQAQIRIAELQQMQRQNQLQLIKELATKGVPVILVGAGAIYYLRSRKKRR